MKTGCWSTNHTQQERDKSKEKNRKTFQANKTPWNKRNYNQFVLEYEGEPQTEAQNTDVLQLLQGLNLDDDGEEDNDVEDTFITSFGDIDGADTLAMLNDAAAEHFITRTQPYHIFTQGRQRYGTDIFRGIALDTCAAKYNTIGINQVKALQRIRPNIVIDHSRANEAWVRFGKGPRTAGLGTVDIDLPFCGVCTFHVIDANTPALLSITDMDRLGMYPNTVRNVLTRDATGESYPFIRKFDHPFLLLDDIKGTLLWSSFKEEEGRAECHLTEAEIRQLHRRFGHPSARRLQTVLERAGHEVNEKVLQRLAKYCEACQKNGASPGRFKFTLKDDYDFNFEIYIDVVTIDGHPVLHVVDSSTRFQAARWLHDMTPKALWEALRACWIDVYTGPPNIVVHDPGSNLDCAEFRINCASMAITAKQVPLEAHNSVGRVERYHTVLRRAYTIIKQEMAGMKVDKAVMLQMAVKSINDTAGPDGIVPTLLVFGTYPRMTSDDPPNPSIHKRAYALKLAMKEVRKFYAERQIQNALATPHGPVTWHLKSLPINSEVLVWKEKGAGEAGRGAWTGPHKFLGIDGENVRVEITGHPRNPRIYRSVVVKEYFTPEQLSDPDPTQPQQNHPPQQNEPPSQQPPSSQPEAVSPREPRRSNRLRQIAEDTQALMLGDCDIYISPVEDEPETPDEPACVYIFDETSGIDTVHIRDGDDVAVALIAESTVFMTGKEKLDMELAKRLRAEGIITSPGKEFEESDQVEWDGLRSKKVFEIIPYNEKTMAGIRIFRTRLVCEIKGKGTPTPYEKTRLVLQGHSDEGKRDILTQSPTIQRASQRLILVFAPSLGADYSVYLRDITQAYCQSLSEILRIILATIPKEFADKYPPESIIHILKPLYGIAEAGTHWHVTYLGHHVKALEMEQSAHDPCLLVTKTPGVFGLVGMQTDDTLILANKPFADKEDEKLAEAGFAAKPRQELTVEEPILFNGCRLTLNAGGNGMKLAQKDQGKRLELVDFKSATYKEDYRRQQARGAYISTICQPEASFDMSRAAQQTKEPSEDDVKALNTRLQWQMDNLERGFNYVPIDLKTAKMFVFVDASFANNQDLTSQLGISIIIGNEKDEQDYFKLKGNMFYHSSTKCKRVTRSALASELYAMVHGADIAIAISATLDKITKQLGLPKIPTVILTDSKSLYECMVKLGTTKEKRLMIDIMALRQSYERREFYEVRWIKGDDNLADAFTKVRPNRALEKFIDTNEIKVGIDGWVERKEKNEE